MNQKRPSFLQKKIKNQNSQINIESFTEENNEIQETEGGNIPNET